MSSQQSVKTTTTTSTTREDASVKEFSLHDNELHEQPVSVLALTWNVQSVRHAERAGSGNLPATWTAYKRYDPDFIPALVDILRFSRHDLFACGLQESPKPGCHLFSEALPTALAEIGYVLIKRTRFIGVGKTTFQNLRDNGDIVPRGLRLALFARRAWYDGRRVTVDDACWPCPGVIERVTHCKGAVAITVHVPRIGRIGFLNCHLPFNAASVAADNASRIIGGVANQSHCLRTLVKEFYAKHRPHYMIVMGDMNFRMLNRSNNNNNNNSSNGSNSAAGGGGGGETVHVDPVAMWRLLKMSRESRAALYRARDELRLAIEYNALPPFCEGVDDIDGPAAFMPTGKMNHGRQSGDTELRAYYFGNDNTQNPSWCDRVLYARSDRVLEALRACATTFASSAGAATAAASVWQERYVEGCGSIRCVAYDRFESGQTMTLSDHSAVVAHIVVEPIEYPQQRQHHDEIATDDNDREESGGREETLIFYSEEQQQQPASKYANCDHADGYQNYFFHYQYFIYDLYRRQQQR